MTKALVWLFYHAVLPLAPVMIVKGISWLQRGATKKIFEIIKNGQIFFYCTALTSTAIADMGKLPNSVDTRPWTIGMLTILILSIVAFTVAANDKAPADEGRCGWSSVAMAFTTIVAVLYFRHEVCLL